MNRRSMIPAKTAQALPVALSVILSLTPGLALAPALAEEAPSAALEETPLERTRYWLGCFAALGAYESITRGVETDLDRARLARLDLLAPRMDAQLDELAAMVGEDVMAAETEATYDSVTGVARALAAQEDGIAMVIAKFGPQLDGCGARAETLPLPAPSPSS